jgi:hypothetical protein
MPQCNKASINDSVLQSRASASDAPLMNHGQHVRGGYFFLQHMWPCFSNLGSLQWGNPEIIQLNDFLERFPNGLGYPECGETPIWG